MENNRRFSITMGTARPIRVMKTLMNRLLPTLIRLLTSAGATAEASSRMDTPASRAAGSFSRTVEASSPPLESSSRMLNPFSRTVKPSSRAGTPSSRTDNRSSRAGKSSSRGQLSRKMAKSGHFCPFSTHNPSQPRALG